MKKQIVLLILLTGVISFGFAQSYKGHIGVSFGPALPLGDFASRAMDNKNAGWAKTGMNIDLSFSHKLGSGNFGITGLIRRQTHTTDAVSIAEIYENNYPEAYWKAEFDNWLFGGVLLGGFGSFPITEKVNFDVRAMIGYFKFWQPSNKITGSLPGVQVWIKQEEETSLSFSCLAGVGFKFDIGKSVLLLANLDCFYANPEFVNVKSSNSNGESGLFTNKQMILSLNPNIGIAAKI